MLIHPRVSDGTLRPSVCLHHILARAPPELQLPHRRKGWSQARYLAWLENGDKMKAASLDSESHADYAELPKQLLRTLVDTARAARLGLSEDVLEELSMLPFDSENHEGGTGRRDL